MKNIFFILIFFSASLGFAQQQVTKEPVSSRRGQAVDVQTPDSLLNNTQSLIQRGATEYKEPPLKPSETNNNQEGIEKKTISNMRKDDE